MIVLFILLTTLRYTLRCLPHHPLLIFVLHALAYTLSFLIDCHLHLSEHLTTTTPLSDGCHDVV